MGGINGRLITTKGAIETTIAPFVVKMYVELYTFKVRQCFQLTLVFLVMK